MKILMISSYLPYPLYDGGAIRLYNLLKRLKKNHEITLICEIRPNQARGDVEEVEKICKRVITVPRQKQWSISNVLKSGFSSNSFLITGHTLLQMRDIIANELRTGSFDLIHIETSYVMQNLPLTTLPVVLVEHNIEYMIYQKFMDKAPFFLKPFLKIDISKLKKREEAFWKKATQVVAVSILEKNLIEKTGVNVKTVYNGVDLESFKYKNVDKIFETQPKQFLFIGNFKWLQNRDSARWIIQEMWPKIKSQTEENIVLRIVGRSMPEDIKNTRDKTIIIEENSKRITQDIFTESFALLAPIRIGGGSQYKILEAMAVGTPVITTALGLSGLDIRGDRDILVADNVSGLADKALDLLREEKLYKDLAVNGREQIEKKYDWTMVTKELESIYRELVEV